MYSMYHGALWWVCALLSGDHRTQGSPPSGVFQFETRSRSHWDLFSEDAAIQTIGMGGGRHKPCLLLRGVKVNPLLTSTNQGNDAPRIGFRCRGAKPPYSGPLPKQ